jgi:hypothetical protein
VHLDLRGRRSALPVAVSLELTIAAAVFGLYRLGRLLTRDSPGEAARNARRVIDFERAVGLFTERTVQRWMLPLEGVVAFLNRYYVFLHFPVTVTFLVGVFVFRREEYPRIRNWFAAVTLLALAIHIAFPLAPPRMIPGFVDTLRTFGPQIYTADTTDSLANQFAAMPSLHFGWALMVGLGLRRLWRRASLVWLLHPFITLVAIVVTGNHYWTDALVAAALALLLARLLYPIPRSDDAPGRAMESTTRASAPGISEAVPPSEEVSTVLASDQKPTTA